MILSSDGVFSVLYPEHDLTGLYRSITTQLGF